MPSTRRSLPTSAAAGPAPTTTASSSSPAPVAQDDLTAKQKREMRKLQIDAKAAIVGDLKEAKKDVVEGKGEVYHYRGAVYARTGNEPEEWLQQEPERFKSKKRKADDVEVEGDGGELGVENREARERKKRKISGDAHEDGGGSEWAVNERKKRRVGDVNGVSSEESSARAAISSTSSKKRRTSASNNNSNMESTAPTKRKRVSDPTDESTSEQPRKKTRPTTTTTIHSPPTAAPAPSTKQTPKEKTKTRRAPTTPTSRLAAAHAEKMRFDYTINGGHDLISTSEARARARAAGFQVQPLPQSTLDSGRAERRQTAAESTAVFVKQLAGLNAEIKKLEREKRELRVWEEKWREEKVRRGCDVEGEERARARGKRWGVCVPRMPEGMREARRAWEMGRRRDSGVGDGDGDEELLSLGVERKKGTEGFSEDRAEEVLRQGRMKGESFAERDRRFERERGLLDDFFANNGGGKA